MDHPVSLNAAFERPFDIFVGTWTGGVTIFNYKGEPLSYWPSAVRIQWKNRERTILHYEQYMDQLADHLARQPNVDQQGHHPLGQDLIDKLLKLAPIKINVELTIDGKRASGVSSDKRYVTQAAE